MFLSICRRDITDWFGRRSNIGVVSLKEFLSVIYFFISCIQKICIMCRNVDEVMGSSVLNLLPDFLHLEVQCLPIKG